MKDCNGCVHWNGITGYKILDCPETTVWAGHYQRNAYSYPMGSNSGGFPYALALSGQVHELQHGWNDQLWGFSIHKVRGKRGDEISYDIPTNGLNSGHAGEILLPKQGISADRSDVILGNIKSSDRASTPCPGGTGKFMQGARKVRCFYSKDDASKLRHLHSNKNGITNDPRASMFSKLKQDFCGVTDNVFKNPGGGICLEYDEGKRIAKEYCRHKGRIATDANCTKDNLGNHYDELAAEYCKKTGRNIEWCSCYNVSNDVCKTHSNAAGCKKKRDTYDKLVEATPKDYKNSWNGMAACFGKVCTGKKYIPANSNQNCNRPVQVCVQDFDIQGIADSTINATCEQTANTNTQPSAGDSPSGVSPSGGSPSGGSPSGGSPSGGSPSGETPLDKNAQSRVTSAFGNITDTQKKAAVGLTAMFLFLIFVLIIF